jgi:hypothetical protein
VAEIVAADFDCTVEVWIVNFAEVLPAGMVTDEETVAIPLLLVSATAIPPAGAATLIVTVPAEDFPPVTVEGLRLNAVSNGGLTVS